MYRRHIFAALCVCAAIFATDLVGLGASGTEALVIRDDTSLYMVTGSQVAELQRLPLGDKVTLFGKTQKLHIGGIEQSATLVKSGEEFQGWVLSSAIASDAVLSAVRSVSAPIFVQAQGAKPTGRSIPRLSVVAVFASGGNTATARVSGYAAEGGEVWDSVFVDRASLTMDETDVQAAILHNRAMHAPTNMEKRRYLSRAVSQYGSSVFASAVKEELTAILATYPRPSVAILEDLDSLQVYDKETFIQAYTLLAEAYSTIAKGVDENPMDLGLHADAIRVAEIRERMLEVKGDFEADLSKAEAAQVSEATTGISRSMIVIGGLVDPLVGTWKGEYEGAIDYFAFKADGTLRLVHGFDGQFVELGATWKRSSATSIVVKANAADSEAQESSVSIVGNTLTLTSAGQSFAMNRTNEDVPVAIPWEELLTKAMNGEQGQDQSVGSEE